MVKILEEIEQSEMKIVEMETCNNNDTQNSKTNKRFMIGELKLKVNRLTE